MPNGEWFGLTTHQTSNEISYDVFLTTDFERVYDWASSLVICGARYWRCDKALAVAIGEGSDLIV
jgi:hypothetical protein